MMYQARSNPQTLSKKTAKVAFMALLVSSIGSVSGFQPAMQKPGAAFSVKPSHQRSTQVVPSIFSSSKVSSSSSTTTARSMTLEEVNTFYQTYPLQAAVLTCGVKASFADLIAQVRSWSESEPAIELRRNAAYIIYGGIFIGLFCHIEYDILFPALFGTGHDAMTVVKEVLFDNFVSAPLLWLPPAYFIKAVMFDYPLKEGLDRYFTDIDEGLLNKYWSVWLPAQTVSFSLLPDHLRVLFMACISFGWFIVLSSCQSQTDNAATEEAS